MTKKLFVTGIGAILFYSVPAHADWFDKSTSEFCLVGKSWELGTTILIRKSITEDKTDLTGSVTSDEVLIYIGNYEWTSLKHDPENLISDFTLRFEDEDGNWMEGRPYIGDTSLLLVTKLEYLKNFRYSETVLITRDGKRVGAFEWGLGYRLRAFENCIASARAPIEERERQERVRKDTPIDPFLDQ